MGVRMLQNSVLKATGSDATWQMPSSTRKIGLRRPRMSSTTSMRHSSVQHLFDNANTDRSPFLERSGSSSKESKRVTPLSLLQNGKRSISIPNLLRTQDKRRTCDPRAESRRKHLFSVSASKREDICGPRRKMHRSMSMTEAFKKRRETLELTNMIPSSISSRNVLSTVGPRRRTSQVQNLEESLPYVSMDQDPLPKFISVVSDTTDDMEPLEDVSIVSVSDKSNGEGSICDEVSETQGTESSSLEEFETSREVLSCEGSCSEMEGCDDLEMWTGRLSFAINTEKRFEETGTLGGTWEEISPAFSIRVEDTPLPGLVQ